MNPWLDQLGVLFDSSHMKIYTKTGDAKCPQFPHKWHLRTEQPAHRLSATASVDELNSTSVFRCDQDVERHPPAAAQGNL
jgi:hypothetical protein